jgi:hypothetical protein
MTPAEIQSAFAAARTAYFANAGYDATGSAAECRLFITACRKLLMLPKRASSGERTEEVEHDLTLIRDQLNDASSWLVDAVDQADGGGAVTHADFTGFRE